MFSVGTDHSSSNNPVQGPQNDTVSEVATSLADKCVDLWKQAQSNWVGIPTQTEIQNGKTTSCFAYYPGTSSKTEGEFIIHISVNPAQMPQAIPLVLNILHQQGNPDVRIHYQTETFSSGEHYVGNEFELIFSKQAEQQEETTHTIKNLLSQIQYAFQRNGIHPENGLVLTNGLRRYVTYLPEGVQNLEKYNIQAGKFERRIPGSPYFYYRHYKWTSMPDDAPMIAHMSEEERLNQNILLQSEVAIRVVESPINAHNPLGIKDPYAHLQMDG